MLHLLRLKATASGAGLARDKNWQHVGRSPGGYDTQIVVGNKILHMFCRTQPCRTPCSTCPEVWVFQEPVRMDTPVEIPKTHSLLGGMLLQHPVVIACPETLQSSVSVCAACQDNLQKEATHSEIRARILSAFCLERKPEGRSGDTVDIDELSDDADELADSLVSGKTSWDLPETPLCWGVFEKKEGLYHHKTRVPKPAHPKYEYDSSVFSDDEEEEVSADSLSIHTTTTSVLSVDSKF